MNAHTILKKLKLDSTSRDALIGIIIAVLVGANLLLTTTSFRLDLSKGKAYSLSSSSYKVMSQLKDPAEIIFFVSENVPTSFVTTKSQVADLLREYRNGSNKVTVKTVDPKRDEASAKDAADYGVMPVEFSQLENDQFAVSNGYFGIGIKVKDKKAAIPRIDASTLEYNITSLLYKLSQKEDQKVVILGASSGFSMDGSGQGDTVNTLSQVLEQQFVISSATADSLGKDIKTLILLDNPSEKIDEKTANSVREYLKNSGKAIIMTSGLDVSNQLMVSTPESKLKGLLSDYGIKVNPDLVLSKQSEIINFGSSNNSRVLVKYPYWISTNVFNPDASYTSNVGYLSFPWSSTITFTKKDGIDQKQIVRSTKDSWVRSGMTDARPQDIAEASSNELGEKVLVGYAKSKKYNSELIVIPTVKFVQDAFLGRSGNLEFVLNLVNEFASGGLLSGIRSRASTAVQIPSMTASQKDMFKWGNVLLLPALFAAYGA
ncbi:MAG: GldG family protein [Patescibacteria group bacterium]